MSDKDYEEFLSDFEDEDEYREWYRECLKQHEDARNKAMLALKQLETTATDMAFDTIIIESLKAKIAENDQWIEGLKKAALKRFK